MNQIIPLTLEWFSKRNDSFIGGETCCMDLELALNLIGIDWELDPYVAYDYKVSQKIAKKIQKYYKHHINLKEFSYFLCRYSDNICPEITDRNNPST